VAQTPGQRFRNLLTVCEDYVPVADVVGPDCPVDNDVVVSPPPTKRTRRNKPAFASLACTSLTQLEDDEPDNNAAATARYQNQKNDDDSSDDGDRKLPAKRDLTSDDGDRKLPAEHDTDKGDALPSIDEVDDDNDGEIDAFINGYYADDDPRDNESHDDDVPAQDRVVEDESTANGAGEDDANGGGEGVVNEVALSAVVDNLDPSSLFLHAEEDADSLMAFFADDSNYDDEGQREPVIDVDNE
jgi:hypothetical protein